mmetsp:Transcript_77447/g.239065  ORF Transcript_77447/g.239065 Transcript_77447/m.239065 type:complete len:386 (+) Transcript_77447:138-1295(+)
MAAPAAGDAEAFCLGGEAAELQVGASWRRLASGGPGWHARSDHAVVSTAGGGVQVLGGVNKGAWCYGDVWRSSDSGASWSAVPVGASGRWLPRSGHAVVLLEEPGAPPRLLLLGGVGKDRMFSDVWESADGGSGWRELAARSSWQPRYGHRAVPVSGGGLVLTGGVTTGGFLADVWRSADGGRTWTASADGGSPWAARAAHALVRVRTQAGEALVLLAGMGEDGVLGDVWHSPDLGASWHPALGRSPWPARSGPAAVPLAGGRVLLLGGFTGCDYLADVWTSGDLGRSWSQVVAAAPWLPRYCHGCVAIGGHSVLVLGGHSEDSSLSDVWESPDRVEVQRHATVALVLGRRLETLRGISRETWCNRVMPYLLPLGVLYQGLAARR